MQYIIFLFFPPSFILTIMATNQTEANKARSKAMKGNKNSVGHGCGRPRTFEPEIEAEALIKWAKDPDKLILRAFAPERGYVPSRMDDWQKESLSFREAYGIAKAMIGARREQLLIENGSSKPFERYADWYDELLFAHEQLKERYSAEIKSRIEAESTAKPEETARHEAVMEQLKGLQDAQRASARKSDDNRSKTDNKSE